jgi:uridine kinase
LAPLRGGATAGYQVYDWSTDCVSRTVVDVSAPIVVVEGVYALSDELVSFYDFSIWVECPREVRLARGLARDGEGARARWEADWMPGEDEYIERANPKERANMVCDGNAGDESAGVWVIGER